MLSITTLFFTTVLAALVAAQAPTTNFTSISTIIGEVPLTTRSTYGSLVPRSTWKTSPQSPRHRVLPLALFLCLASHRIALIFHEFFRSMVPE